MAQWPAEARPGDGRAWPLALEQAYPWGTAPAPVPLPMAGKGAQSIGRIGSGHGHAIWDGDAPELTHGHLGRRTQFALRLAPPPTAQQSPSSHPPGPLPLPPAPC